MPDYAPRPAAQTPAFGEVPITIVAVGDISCATDSPNFNNGEGNEKGCHMKQTAELARRLKPAAILLLGDLQYDKGEYAQFKDSYGKSWGAPDLKAISRPVPGNHEYGTKDASGYYEYFGSAAGDPAKGYYSYDQGSWHIVALNSNCKYVPCDENSEQYRWLQQDLADHPVSCTIAYYHHPLFSSGTHGTNDFMRPIYAALDMGGVDVILAGHDHLYERFAPQDSRQMASATGPRSFIAGTGGKDRYPFREQEPNSEFRLSSAFGVLKLDLAKDSYAWSFIDEANTIQDSGTGSCN